MPSVLTEAKVSKEGGKELARNIYEKLYHNLEKERETPKLVMQGLVTNVDRDEAQEAAKEEKYRENWRKMEDMLEGKINTEESVDLAEGYRGIRGYSGGALHILREEGSGDLKLKFPFRDEGAPVEKLKLDIGSGLMYDKSHLDWLGVSVTESVEEGVPTVPEEGKIVLPDYGERIFNKKVRNAVVNEIRKAMEDPESSFWDTIDDPEEINKEYTDARIIVPKNPFTVKYQTEEGFKYIQTGLVPEFHTSGLEGFLYNLQEIPEGYHLQDSENAGGTHFNRHTVTVDLEEDVDVSRDEVITFHSYQNGEYVKQKTTPEELVKDIIGKYEELKDGERPERLLTPVAKESIDKKYREGPEEFKNADLEWLDMDYWH